MKIYTHDYSKPTEVESWLYKAQVYINQEHYGMAANAILKARRLLGDYLSLDNMVEDPNSCGWIRLVDYENAMNMITNQNQTEYENLHF